MSASLDQSITHLIKKKNDGRCLVTGQGGHQGEVGLDQTDVPFPARIGMECSGQTH